MFEKHVTTNSTGQLHEKAGLTGYYRIWEVENGRYIDEDRYVPYLEWNGNLEEKNIDPVPLTLEEKWEQVRAERTRRLQVCDWTALTDAPLNADQKSLWQAYRDELRDIPQTFSDPDTVVWPESPA